MALDFDASRSIVVTGNGRHILKPVIKTVATAISGSLSGVVTPAATHPTVWAVTGTDTSTTMADTAGFFRLRYLLPATYSLTIVPADTSYRDTTLANVIVVAAMNTNAGTITLRKKYTDLNAVRDKKRKVGRHPDLQTSTRDGYQTEEQGQEEKEDMNWQRPAGRDRPLLHD